MATVNPQTYIPLDIRFWQKVRFGEGMDDCWEWTGFCFPSGHGQFHMGDRDVKASRAVWLLYNGPLTSKEYICHKCDNPKCVRLDHLYKGTHQTNQADKRGKEKHRHENATYVKLDWNKVSYIRQSRGSESQSSLAAFFEVSLCTISRIWRGVDKGGWREEVPLNG